MNTHAEPPGRGDGPEAAHCAAQMPPQRGWRL